MNGPLIGRGRSAMVRGCLVAATLVAVISGCSSSDTTTLDPTTTSAPKSSTSAKPSTDAYEGLVETLKKMGISDEQARCVVDKMDDATADIGDKATAEDQTRIEKLLKECKLSG